MATQLERPPAREGASGDVTVVHFTGSRVSLDEETIRHIRGPLLALGDEPGESGLVLDLGNVECLGSSALGTLVTLHKKLRARGRHLTVDNLSPQVREVFTVARLDELLDLRPAGQEFEKAARERPSGSPPAVLVVDDETAVLCVLAARLRGEDYTVWLAGHGHQAVAIYR